MKPKRSKIEAMYGIGHHGRGTSSPRCEVCKHFQRGGDENTCQRVIGAIDEKARCRLFEYVSSAQKNRLREKSKALARSPS
jgi:hypothetical protein